jgi:hypothetical protein
MHGSTFFWEFFGQTAAIIIGITVVSAILGKILIKDLPDEESE